MGFVLLFRFIIRKLRFAVVVYSGFTRGEYRIALVDFIYSSRGRYKEAAVGLWGLYWLHQWGIPHRMCRFYWFLAGAVGKRQGISIPYPSPTPLLTPGGVRCGGAYLLPRAWDNIGFRCPVQVDHPHFDISFGCFVFGLGLFAFQKISLGFGRTFFIGGGMDCSFLRLRGVLIWIFVGITADRATSSNFVGCKSISPMLPGAKVS